MLWEAFSGDCHLYVQWSLPKKLLVYSHPKMFVFHFFVNAVLNSRTKLFTPQFSPAFSLFLYVRPSPPTEKSYLRYHKTGDIKIRNKTILKKTAKVQELWNINFKVARVFNELQSALIDLTIKTIVSTFVFIKLFHGTGLSSHTPWKHQKTRRIGRVQWHEMG